MTVLIIEGSDLSGKTFAIEKIAKHFNSGFILKNSLKPKVLEDSKKIYAQYWNILSLIHQYHRMNPTQLIILDRLYPSQAVYSFLRGKDEMFSKEMLALEKFCLLQKIRIVYLNTPENILEQRYNLRGDEHIKKTQLRILKERYDKFMENTMLPVLKLNTSLEEFVWLKQVEEFIK